MSYNYNPQPPRVWNRVQSACSTINDSNNNNTTLPNEIDKQMLLKGNILQYKKNSSNLTKNQRYSKIAKGQWTNRTKTWATQSQTYSNPNTSHLLRVNYSKLPIPFNAILPLDCSANFIKDGGNLICNKVADPCTDVVIKTTHNIVCYSTTDSDVPGPPQQLCWNDRVQTWYPRQNLTMNNSTSKWPEGYKGFTSAVSPGAPYLMIDVSGNIATLTWKIIFNDCLPVNSFNIYENGQFVQNVPYTTTSISYIVCSVNTFYVTAVSGVNESGPSNTVIANGLIIPPVLTVNNIINNNATLSWTFNSYCDINKFNIYNAFTHTLINSVNYPTISYIVSLNGCVTSFYVTAVSGVNESGPSNIVNAYNSFIATGSYNYTYNSSTGIYTVIFYTTGTIQVCYGSGPLSVILVGGGGGGAGGSNTYNTTIKGGGGGGGGQTNFFTTTSYTNGNIYNINVGTGGSGGIPGGGSTGNGYTGNTTTLNLNTNYTASGGQGGQGAKGGGGGGSGLNGGEVSEPTSIPSYSNGNGGMGVNSGTLFGGGGGGGGSDGAGPVPNAIGVVAGGGGGGVSFNLTTSVITTAGGGGGGAGYNAGIGGTNYGGNGANSNGSNGNNGTYGAGGGGGSGAQNNTVSPNYGTGYGGNGGNGFCILSFSLTYPP